MNTIFFSFIFVSQFLQQIPHKMPQAYLDSISSPFSWISHQELTSTRFKIGFICVMFESFAWRTSVSCLYCHTFSFVSILSIFTAFASLEQTTLGESFLSGLLGLIHITIRTHRLSDYLRAMQKERMLACTEYCAKIVLMIKDDIRFILQ